MKCESTAFSDGGMADLNLSRADRSRVDGTSDWNFPSEAAGDITRAESVHGLGLGNTVIYPCGFS